MRFKDMRENTWLHSYSGYNKQMRRQSIYAVVSIASTDKYLKNV